MNPPPNNSEATPESRITSINSAITSPYPQGVILSLELLRRQTERFELRIGLRVSVPKSRAQEQRTESLDVSEGGMFFATNLRLRRGAPVQLVFKMPEEITHKPAAEWVCMAHVVHLRPLSFWKGWLGVGVQFDCYEVVPAQAPQS